MPWDCPNKWILIYNIFSFKCINMGRIPIGEKKMSNAEKQKWYREKDKKVWREKHRIKKAINHGNLKKDNVKYKNYLKQKAANRKMAFPAFSRSLNKAKRNLLKEHVQKYVVAKALFEDSIQATPKENMIAFYLAEYT